MQGLPRPAEVWGWHTAGCKNSSGSAWWVGEVDVGSCMPARPGNNPWPIGVTSVGIHERSAREKISHVMNGGAHIMNDEATRKYLQARFFRASRELV